MAMPPRNNNYFNLLLNNTKEILEEYGVYIEIGDYEKTIKKLESLSLSESNKAWNLAMELNAWSDYFSDIRSNCKKILADLEADKMAAIATASYSADNKKVANGDRLANKDDSVIQARRKRNAVESLCELLDSKIAFLERSHYVCKKTFELSQQIKD